MKTKLFILMLLILTASFLLPTLPRETFARI